MQGMRSSEEKILNAVREKIKTLISAKKSGKIELNLELNMSQGYIGSAFIRDYSQIPREDIFLKG